MKLTNLVSKALLESKSLNNKTIINVDIQPEYEDYVTFDLHEWAKFINKSSSKNGIIFLYNGEDTLGMIKEDSYIDWLYNLGVKERVLLQSTFYDKGYAFFRYCMDSSIDDESIVSLIKYMINNDIADSRDIDEDMWIDFMEATDHSFSEIRELLEDAGDMIHLPDLMDFLENYQNIILTGGGINECLKEVELALMALDKKYETYSKFTY